MNKIWNIAIYARVSTDKKEQSESIPAQVENLKKWILDKSKNDKKAIYNLVDIYEDQGRSGSNFDRDAFIRMKADIENGKINMVVTRDLSRFSRNYILAGYYLEDYFKVNGVRFISVLDNVDTELEFDDIIPFKNILNEMYIKDCSKRVKSALNSRMQRGSSIASKPLYGYKLEEIYEGNQKTILLKPRGDETTEVVKEIFNLYLQGWGAGRIATHLNDRNIPPPSQLVKNFKRKKFGIWTNNTILSMLRNPKYGGYMVQGRYKKVSYKSKIIKQTSKDEWIWGAEFDGIIDKNTFNKVQEMMKTRKEKNYRYKNNTIHPFSTVLVCGRCNGSMSYRSKYLGYKCTNSQMGGGRCTPHSIKEQQLIEIVRNEIKRMIKNNIDENEVVKGYENLNLENSHEKELENINEKLESLDNKFAKLYEDKLNEVITERNFNNIIGSIQKQQEDLLRRKLELEKILNNDNNEEEVFKLYKKEIDDLLSLKNIDRNLVETLIDKIVIEESENKKEKFVNVYFKFRNRLFLEE